MSDFASHIYRSIRGVVACTVCLTWSASTFAADAAPQRAFSSPERAIEALTAALQMDDQAELLAIFGQDAEDVLSSGDPVADRHGREVLAVAVGQRWSLQDAGTDAKKVVVGFEDWPFPIPLVETADGWIFDTEAGAQEILARRIGRNELSTIRVCETYVRAQLEYAGQGRDGKPAGTYAQRIQSTPGKHDGLYWPAADGESFSPLGAFVAGAAGEGYTPDPEGKPIPFHGYYFRILTAQGPEAIGGEKNYVVEGDMTGGFALLAYPAEYGDSGIMTFMVNQDGTVYERDLGPKTEQLVLEITSFNPDDSWTPVEEVN